MKFLLDLFSQCVCCLMVCCPLLWDPLWFRWYHSFSRKEAGISLVIGVHLHLLTVYLCLSLFVLRCHPWYSCTCPVFVWCPNHDTSVACGLCGRWKAPQGMAGDCYKDLNGAFCSPKWNSCHRPFYTLKHRNPSESAFTPCVFIFKVLQVLFVYFVVSSFLSDAFWLPF